mmetsp:Transcript_19661/g.42556  ORF Transcript_19661/g.42556 Transcript_19661/m.42556 type:complete len:872 (+) Transcript_19661:29-2644(+)
MSLPQWILFTVFAVGLSTSEEALLQAALEVAGDDECLAGAQGDCAVNALQIRAVRRFAVTSSVDTEAASGRVASGGAGSDADEDESKMDSAAALEAEEEGLAAARNTPDAGESAGSASPDDDAPASENSAAASDSDAGGPHQAADTADAAGAAGKTERGDVHEGEQVAEAADTAADTTSHSAQSTASAKNPATAAAAEDSGPEASAEASSTPDAAAKKAPSKPEPESEAALPDATGKDLDPAATGDGGGGAEAEEGSNGDKPSVGREAPAREESSPKEREVSEDSRDKEPSDESPPRSERTSAYGQFRNGGDDGGLSGQSAYGPDFDWQDIVYGDGPDFGAPNEDGLFPEDAYQGLRSSVYGRFAEPQRRSAYGQFPGFKDGPGSTDEPQQQQQQQEQQEPEEQRHGLPRDADEALQSGPESSPQEQDEEDRGGPPRRLPGLGDGFAKHKFKDGIRLPGSLPPRMKGKGGSEEGGRQPGDDHALNFIDSKDYRQDAIEFLKDALKKDPTGSEHCDLTEMNYSTVVDLWNTFRDEWMAKIPADTPRGARRVFLGRVREAFPELLFQGNPVVVRNATEALGWDSEAWNQENITETLGNLSLQEMSFGYPIWLGNSLEEGLGANADGSPLHTTFEQYFKKNMSAEDIFLFLNEENPDKDPRLEFDSENEAVRRIRDLFTPTPPFAWPAKERLALVAIDGRGSSHGFHEHTAVWQVQVQGYKMWHFMPPSTPMSFGRHKRGGSPMVKGQPWEHPNGCAFLKKVPVPPGTTQCLVGPGSMVVMPANWVHSTCGLDQYTVGVGGWLHGQPTYRGGDTMNYLQWSLKDLYREAAAGWTLRDSGINLNPDEEEEILAGLSMEKALLDREAHPADYDDNY